MAKLTAKFAQTCLDAPTKDARCASIGSIQNALLDFQNPKKKAPFCSLL